MNLWYDILKDVENSIERNTCSIGVVKGFIIKILFCWCAQYGLDNVNEYQT